MHVQNITVKTVDEAIASANIVVFGTSWCPWCKRALALLDRLGIAHCFFDVEKFPELSPKSRTGQQTVPQVFVNRKFIGGYESLVRYLKV